MATRNVSFFLSICLSIIATNVLAQDTTEVMTLLETRCLSCHDTKARSGGVDLSTYATAQKSGTFSKNTAGLAKISAVVLEGKMPPNGTLTKEEKEKFRLWVEQGAKYSHSPLKAKKPKDAPLWSFQPVRTAVPPKSKFDALSTNPIDRFVFAELAKKGLQPSPLANKLELLRRVTIDLTGLPPTPEEVNAFVNDKRPDAYLNVVDKLLSSPAYGERWGRHWLDVVRFGESNGYEQNHLRPNAWHYRDYVIQSFNKGTPYNRFILEQLAGDAFSNERPEIEAATGFMVAGIHDTVGNQTEEGKRIQRISDLEDMVSTTADAFLGLTVGCARCHDHKFDPIPQKDFYRLAACFGGVRHGERGLLLRSMNAKEIDEEKKVRLRLTQVQNEINTLDSAARAILQKQENAAKDSRPAVNSRRNEDTFDTVTAKIIRFTIFKTNDGMEPCIDELQIYGDDPTTNLALLSNGAKAIASSLLPSFVIHQVHHVNDGKLGNDNSWIAQTKGSGWVQIEFPQPKKVRRVVWSRDGGEIHRFDDRLPVSYRIEASMNGTKWQMLSSEIGRKGSSNYIHPDVLLSVLTPEQRTQRSELLVEQAELKAQAADLTKMTNAYIGKFVDPETTYLLNRGDVMQQKEVILPGALSQLTGMPADFPNIANKPEQERRLALARWIASPTNPLTPRVLVNRVWQYHFGKGIVATSSDFGRNGTKPSHPELLDWLATVFIRTPKTKDELGFAWKLKPLHRLMVTSYTYRQSSKAVPQGMAKDAGNVYLWRMPLRRMEAEAVRDAILTVSGSLNRTMGGPGYRLFKYNVVNVAIYEPLEDPGPETWRRGVYRQEARSIRDDLLGVLDCPESSQRAPRRESTTTALQALSLFNGPFLNRQVEIFAKRVEQQAGSAKQAQIDRAFLLAFSRLPSTQEKDGAISLVDQHGVSALCRALLNANEFLYY